jgi:hypothetical protein
MKGRLKPKPIYVKTMDDATWRNAGLIERAVHVARSQEQMKVRELSENFGGMVTVYLKVAGWLKPAYWCAAFVYWCLLESGADKKKLWSNPASTYFMWLWASKNGRLVTNRVMGRSVGVYNKASGGHTWFFLNDQGDTIEGNTNVKGSRNGIGVFERNRSLSEMKGYPRYGCIRITDDLYAN